MDEVEEETQELLDKAGAENLESDSDLSDKLYPLNPSTLQVNKIRFFSLTLVSLKWFLFGYVKKYILVEVSSFDNSLAVTTKYHDQTPWSGPQPSEVGVLEKIVRSEFSQRDVFDDQFLCVCLLWAKNYVSE